MTGQTIKTLLDSPCTGHWLKDALETALHRDCVDAARDAETLAKVLNDRVDEIQGR